MSKLKQIIRLRREDESYQSISQIVGCSRNTVKKYLRLIEVNELKEDELLQMEDPVLEDILTDSDEKEKERYKTLEVLFPYFKKELKKTGVTRWILWGEYRLVHPSGYSYSQLCEHYKRWLDLKSASLHIDHLPGDKLYIDFAGKKLHITDRQTGVIKAVEVYVATLGYSQYTYVEALTSQKKEPFIKATTNALNYFGGVPKVLVPDNLKSAVTKASKYEADINETFQDFANHYNTYVLPTRGYKPQDKSLVEIAVNVVYSRIYAPLRNQVFFSIEDLNRAIWELLENYNSINFQKEEVSRRDKFIKTEQEVLEALPSKGYQIKHYKQVKVMKNGHIQLHEDKHYYSVPYKYIGAYIKLTYTATTLSVYHKSERIAYYPRDYKPHMYTTKQEHLCSAHQFVSSWTPEKFIKWAGDISPLTKLYIETVLGKNLYPEQVYRSCVGILSLDKKFGRNRFLRAIKRGHRYQSYSYKTIKNILDKNMDKIDDDDDIKQRTIPFHDNIRGAQNYK